MSNPFIAEIRIFAGNFAPWNWAKCEGQLLAIRQNTQLFSLLGTAFGGNGMVTFGLPNFQDSTPVGQGLGPGLTQRDVGESGGSTAVQLTQQELAAHNHGVGGSNNLGDVALPGPGVVLAQSSGATAYQTDSTKNLVAFNPNAVSPAGSATPFHNNVMPALAATFIIALQGVFPQRE